MARRTLSRRAFLYGAGGGAIAVPLLASWPERRAAADSGSPKRLLVFVRGQGTIVEEVATLGSTETNFTLGPIYESLAPFREKLVLCAGLDDLSCLVDNENAHIRNALHALTGAAIEWNIGAGGSRSPRSAGGPSIDQVVANKPGWGDLTPHRSLQARIGGSYTYTWAGIDQPLEGEGRPSVLFDRLFAEMAMADPAELARLRRQRRSVLDSVAQNVGLVQSGLDYEDRLKLERHLESVRELERTFQEGAGGSACGIPEGPFPDAGYARSRAFIDLLVMSFACDLTRVASLSYGDFDFRWRGLNFPSGWHDAVHAGPTDPSNRANLINSYQFYAEELAYLLASLDAIPEGDCTMLDNTLVLVANNFSCGCNHSFSGKIFTLAGGASFGLAGGRMLDFGGATTNDFFLTVLNLMGFDDTTFGMADFVNGPLAGIR